MKDSNAMNAVVFSRPWKNKTVHRPKPVIIDPTDAVVKVTVVGICGSELHMYRGNQDTECGRIMGHEFTGTIESVGSEVIGFQVGQRVVTTLSVGRPPRLARKYCSVQLPLDITTKRLWLSESELEVAVNALDDDGWNTAGETRTNFYSRTQLICSMIQEDISEFALASLPHNDISVAEDILRRSQSAQASLPSWIKSTEKLNRQSDIQFLAGESALGFKYSELLLYRAVVKRFASEQANEELLRLSSDILRSVMQDVSNTQAAGCYNADLPWILAKFALPTAGVLGLELLRQQQNSEITARPPSCFRRSAVTLTLSNLVALPGLIMPLDGNYRICNQARLALQHILDRVLHSQPTVSNTVDQNGRAFEPK